MPNRPDSISTFIRFIQLKSLRLRTQEQYVRWVTRLAKHSGVACASILTQEEVLTFLHHLQQNHTYEGSTLNQCICGLRLFFRDHLGHSDLLVHLDCFEDRLVHLGHWHLELRE